ncbi:hypothetical protein [Halovenus halobia]|uniref:hypothetical protein n=1 Tax=Halovenus halobia TaxID=3396622 RepID=UPI003F54BDCF
MNQQSTGLRGCAVVAVAVAALSILALGVASSGPASAAAPSVLTQEEPKLECSVSGSGPGYPGNINATCWKAGENEAAVTLDHSGGWGFTATVNSSDPLTVGGTPAVQRGGVTAINKTAAPGEVATVGVPGVPRQDPGFVRAWEEQLSPAGSEVGIATQTSLRLADITSESYRAFAPNPARFPIWLEPGVYEFEVTTYQLSEPLPLEGSGSSSVYDQISFAIDRATTTSGTVTVEIGQCLSYEDTEGGKFAVHTQQEAARAEAQQQLQTVREQRSEDGASVSETTTAASENPNGAMSGGIPSVSDGESLDSLLQSQKQQSSAVLDTVGDLDRLSALYQQSAESLVGEELPPTPAEAGIDISEEQTVEATVAALERRGIEPPAGSDLSLSDYVRTGLDISSSGETPTGHRETTIRVGPNGNILPRHDKLPDADSPCQTGYLQPSTEWLTFEFHEMPGGEYATQVETVDIATSRIQQAAMEGVEESYTDLGAVTADSLAGIDGIDGATDGTVPEYNPDGNEGGDE